jgi:hypothetical protein
MRPELGRRRVDVGLYEVFDPADPSRVIAEVYEGGKSGYRWTIAPDRTGPLRDHRGWDSETLSGAVDGIAAELRVVRSPSR